MSGAISNELLALHVLLCGAQSCTHLTILSLKRQVSSPAPPAFRSGWMGWKVGLEARSQLGQALNREIGQHRVTASRDHCAVNEALQLSPRQKSCRVKDARIAGNLSKASARSLGEAELPCSGLGKLGGRFSALSEDQSAEAHPIPISECHYCLDSFEEHI